jgi:hypothetical protein
MIQRYEPVQCPRLTSSTSRNILKGPSGPRGEWAQAAQSALWVVSPCQSGCASWWALPPLRTSWRTHDRRGRRRGRRSGCAFRPGQDVAAEVWGVTRTSVTPCSASNWTMLRSCCQKTMLCGLRPRASRSSRKASTSCSNSSAGTGGIIRLLLFAGTMKTPFCHYR